LVPPGRKNHEHNIRKEPMNSLFLGVGLKSVDPTIYDGWEGSLTGPVNDIMALATIAAKEKYESTVIRLSQDAKRENVLDCLRMAQKIKSGGYLWLALSMHGTLVYDQSGDECGGYDSAVCLYDGLLLDDDLYAELTKIQAGVHVLVTIDACHSGTALKDSQAIRQMPAKLRIKMSRTITKTKRDASPLDEMKASVTLLSACADNQTALDGDPNGLFTKRMISVYSKGAFHGGLRALHHAVSRFMPETQSPQLTTAGPRDHHWMHSRALSIST
jgi:hypothetical protein